MSDTLPRRRLRCQSGGLALAQGTDAGGLVIGGSGPSEVPFIRRPTSTAPTARLRRSFDWLLWEDKHQRLAAHPALRGCTRQQVRRIARVADEAMVPAGQALVREDRIGYWMFLLEDGSVRLTRRRRVVGALGPGDHLGDVAIVGFGPHPETATAVTDVHSFVVGRVELLSLVREVEPLQENLYPGVSPAAFPEHVRRLRLAGAAAWSKLPKMAVPPASEAELGKVARLTSVRATPATTTAPGLGSFPALAVAVLRRQREARPPVQEGPGLSRRAVALMVGAVLAAVIAFGLLYHPPVVVVSPGTPFDVANDITVEGRPAVAVNGRYLLVPVHLSRPNAFGAVAAIVQGRRRAPARAVPPGTDTGAARRNGRRAFERSREEAVVAAARAAGIPVKLTGDGARVIGDGGGLQAGDVIEKVNGRKTSLASEVVDVVAASGAVGRETVVDVQRSGAAVSVRVATIAGPRGQPSLPVALRTAEPRHELPFRVRFAERDLVGGSGGLVYALALLDMLDERDLAGGRTIAATGGVDVSGAVVPVDFVDEKTVAARRSRSAMFLVPYRTEDGAGGAGVASMADAVAALTGR